VSDVVPTDQPVDVEGLEQPVAQPSRKVARPLRKDGEALKEEGAARRWQGCRSKAEQADREQVVEGCVTSGLIPAGSQSWKSHPCAAGDVGHEPYGKGHQEASRDFQERHQAGQETRGKEEPIEEAVAMAPAPIWARRW
jgi:hypothetical protein